MIHIILRGNVDSKLAKYIQSRENLTTLEIENPYTERYTPSYELIKLALFNNIYFPSLQRFICKDLPYELRRSELNEGILRSSLQHLQLGCDNDSEAVPNIFNFIGRSTNTDIKYIRVLLPEEITVSKFKKCLDELMKNNKTLRTRKWKLVVCEERSNLDGWGFEEEYPLLTIE